jgi:sigma-E factor negative regulatory protein RseA
MDGELGVDEADREIARLKADESLRAHWDTYHLIGDAMRGDRADLPGFSTRFAERLAQEPTVLAPARRAPRGRLQTIVLSIAASVAAIAVVGWVTYSTLVVQPELAGGTLAQAPSVQPAPVQPAPSLLAQRGDTAQSGPLAQPMIAAPQPTLAPPVALASPEHMHEYMLAHQGISPTTAIQGVAPYIRTVSIAGE